jgi:hypothetical protein
MRSVLEIRIRRLILPVVRPLWLDGVGFQRRCDDLPGLVIVDVGSLLFRPFYLTQRMDRAEPLRPREDKRKWGKSKGGGNQRDRESFSGRSVGEDLPNDSRPLVCGFQAKNRTSVQHFRTASLSSPAQPYEARHIGCCSHLRFRPARSESCRFCRAGSVSDGVMGREKTAMFR